MASTNPVQVLEVCKVSPSLGYPESATESSLSLTFFDLMFLRFHPVERIFFYELTESTPDLFHSTILPRLKHSLSLTLLHFLPLAGSLTWPSHASKPFLLYTLGDGVALTVAESDADFHRLSGDHIKEVDESVHYVPKLLATESAASAIALQITYFPYQGFCIGISTHHAILDGKSSIMFVKAWAHFCKLREEEEEHERPSLPPELIPCLDRTLVQDPEDIASVLLNDWSVLTRKMLGKDSNPKSLKLLPFAPTGDSTERVRATFRLSREDIRRIRERVSLDLDKVSKDSHQPKPLHLSSFVIVYAYTSGCMFKARELANNKMVLIGFVADCRARLEPPLPANYFGNCIVFTRTTPTQAKNIMDGNTGVAFFAKELSGCVTELGEGVHKQAKESLSVFAKVDLVEADTIAVAGSTRLEVYGTDFGWGRPKKVEVTSIDRTGSISIAESGDGSGGVEIGCVLKKHQMQTFSSLFVGGIS
ncbi:hypothetical protein Tsubulata_019412 [Turnera subulata]|uniref:Uncharacterized protein n=1 Tax=Turnera subulata TaxID=218843 RepID=A0A9Q0JGF1_9ROSI|nr:hypothetical protein Tsubulata_019412 [Turnera subulata]